MVTPNLQNSCSSEMALCVTGKQRHFVPSNKAFCYYLHSEMGFKCSWEIRQAPSRASCSAPCERHTLTTAAHCIFNEWLTDRPWGSQRKKMTHPDTPDLTIRELVWEAEIKQGTVRYSRGRPRLSAVPPSRRKEGCIHRDHQSPCWVTNACSLLQRKWLSLNSDSELCRHWVIFLSSLLSYVLA